MTIVEVALVIIALALLPVALQVLLRMLGVTFRALRFAFLLAGAAYIFAALYAFGAAISMGTGGSVSRTVAILLAILAVTGAIVRYSPTVEAWYANLSSSGVTLFITGTTALLVGLAYEFKAIRTLETHPDLFVGHMLGGLLAIGSATALLAWAAYRSRAPTARRDRLPQTSRTQELEGP